MSRNSLRPFAACTALLVTVAGCGAGYLLQASDWGERLKEANAKMSEVQGLVSSPQSLFTNAGAQTQAIQKLDEVDAILAGIEAEYPESPPSYHDYLSEGIDELQAAIVDGREGIEKKNVKKLESFRDKAHAASSKLQTWGQKAGGE